MSQPHTLRPVLISGEGALVCSIATCLVMANQPIVVYTDEADDCRKRIASHLAEVSARWQIVPDSSLIKVTELLERNAMFQIAILITSEQLSIKRKMIATLDRYLPNDCIIAVNTESIPLSKIQYGSAFPGRVVGVNWVKPAHTTFFMEIISNAVCDSCCLQLLYDRAKQNWKKDPYIVQTDFSIRARLLSALIREAFFLVENGYVSIEDIDRACRNDAGYYLPFTGNFRYMDLMGTFIYGLVMKDMNPALTKQTDIPDFFTQLIKNDHLGLKEGKGFYNYSDEDITKWEELASSFSYELHDIVEKYQTI